MIEVFKTDVHGAEEANMLCDRLHQSFKQFRVNFDLTDCDKILRICSPEDIEPVTVIRFLKRLGFNAEVLPFLFPLIYLNI